MLCFAGQCPPQDSLPSTEPPVEPPDTPVDKQVKYFYRNTHLYYVIVILILQVFRLLHVIFTANDKVSQSAFVWAERNIDIHVKRAIDLNNRIVIHLDFIFLLTLGKKQKWKQFPILFEVLSEINFQCEK